MVRRFRMARADLGVAPVTKSRRRKCAAAGSTARAAWRAVVESRTVARFTRTNLTGAIALLRSRPGVSLLVSRRFRAPVDGPLQTFVSEATLGHLTPVPFPLHDLQFLLRNELLRF